MNRLRSSSIVFLLLSSFLGVKWANATPSAQDIMAQNEERRKINDVRSSATLTTGGGGASEKVKKFTWWRKLTGDQVHFNTLTRFHFPAEVRNEGILFLEHDQNENEVLLYLPNFKKVRRVETQQQSGSFMGSELSYSDIATPHLEDYTYELIREQLCESGESGGDKVKCYVIVSLPVSEKVKERTGYSKVTHWVRSDNSMVVRAEYAGQNGEVFKKMEASEIKQVDAAKNKWMAHRIRVENLKKGRFTLLQFKDAQVNRGLPDSLFTQQSLSRAQ